MLLLLQHRRQNKHKLCKLHGLYPASITVTISRFRNSSCVFLHTSINRHLPVVIWFSHELLCCSWFLSCDSTQWQHLLVIIYCTSAIWFLTMTRAGPASITVPCCFCFGVFYRSDLIKDFVSSFKTHKSKLLPNSKYVTYQGLLAWCSRNLSFYCREPSFLKR